MSDYDQRQYKRMSDALAKFDWSAFGLRKIIGELELLVTCLQSAGTTWKQSIWSKIGDLEEVNAFMLDQEREEMDDVDKEIIGKALNELILLVNEAKSRSISGAP